MPRGTLVMGSSIQTMTVIPVINLACREFCSCVQPVSDLKAFPKRILPGVVHILQYFVV